LPVLEWKEATVHHFIILNVVVVLINVVVVLINRFLGGLRNVGYWY
jgi:hypothetical protein